MSDDRAEFRPYVEAFREFASDEMAKAAIPQIFWPAQIVHAKPALPPAENGRGAPTRSCDGRRTNDDHTN